MYQAKKKFPIALQLYSLRQSAEKDLAATLALVKSMGYDALELAGLYGRTAEEMRDALKSAGLTAISAHVPYVELIVDMEGTVQKYKTIGCEYIAVPYLNAEHRPGSEGYGDVLENFKKLGRICKAGGIQLLYHNHDFEFIPLADGHIALDALYEEIPAELLQTEIDTCWVKVAGHDPAEYIRKYAERSPIVHLKDFHLQGALDYTPYELIGIRNSDAKSFDDIFSFRALGQGMQDIPAILDASADAGSKWVVIELDAPSPNSTPEDDVRNSLEYLRSIGL